MKREKSRSLALRIKPKKQKKEKENKEKEKDKKKKKKSETLSPPQAPSKQGPSCFQKKEQRNYGVHVAMFEPECIQTTWKIMYNIRNKFLILN